MQFGYSIGPENSSDCQVQRIGIIPCATRQNTFSKEQKIVNWSKWVQKGKTKDCWCSLFSRQQRTIDDKSNHLRWLGTTRWTFAFLSAQKAHSTSDSIVGQKLKMWSMSVWQLEATPKCGCPERRYTLPPLCPWIPAEWQKQPRMQLTWV